MTSTEQPNLGQFGNARGLLIGVTTFQDPSYCGRPLPQTANDARGVGEALCQRLGWQTGNVSVKTGSVTKLQIREAIREIIERIANAGDCTLFLFFLSTHGHIYDRVQRGKTATLLATDTFVRDPLLIADTGLTRDILSAYVDSVPARQKVVILDACFASSALSSMDIAPSETYRDLDAAVFSAAVGRAFAQQDSGLSIFSGRLIDVLNTVNGEVGLGTVFDLISRDIPKTIQRPYQNTNGRYIALGVAGKGNVSEKVVTLSDLLHFAEARLALIIHRNSSWNDRTYVRRAAVEESFWSHLAQSTEVFSVSGAAGTGKTTSMLYLARAAQQAEYPVLWYGRADLEAYPTPKSLVLDTLKSFNDSITIELLDTILLRDKPLLLFLDAVNEWNADTDKIKKFCKEFSGLSHANVRVVLSCREEAWPVLAHAVSRSAESSELPEPSYHLRDFSDAEFLIASSHYGMGPYSDLPMARHPLFLRIFAELNLAPSGGNTITYGLVFERYVHQKLLNIQERYGLDASEMKRRILNLMEAYNTRIIQNIPVLEFFEMVSEKFGSALLEEGFVRRSGNGVVIENESLHHFLLSRILPPDPFAAKDSREFRLTDPWWDAAAIRLLEINDSNRVLEILGFIATNFGSGATLYILNVLIKWSDIEPYRQFVMHMIRKETDYIDGEFMQFISTLFEKYGLAELDFLMDLLRFHSPYAGGNWQVWSWWSADHLRVQIADAWSDGRLALRIIDKFPFECSQILFRPG